MIQNLLGRDAREALRRALSRQIAWIEEMEVLRIVVGPARTRENDEALRDAATFRQRAFGVGNVL
jgi:hypothetical protein